MCLGSSGLLLRGLHRIIRGFFILGTVFVIVSFLPFAARDYITHPKQWSDFLDNFKDYYAYGGQLDEEEVKNRSAEDWAKALERNYISASETNFNFNIKKMGYQARAKWCIGVAVLCVLLNTVPTYFLQRVIQEVQKTQVVSFPDIQKVEIVNPQARRVSPMSQEKNNAAASRNSCSADAGNTAANVSSC